jgi:hypothetical protein
MVPGAGALGDFGKADVTDLFEQLNSADAIARVRGSPGFPPAITSFLGRLSLLHGVPFRYLVPDELLLEKESLKFFYIDADWVSALVNGALSVGRADQTLLLLNKSGAGNFMADILAEAREIRRRGLAERKEAERRADMKPPAGFDPEARTAPQTPEAATTSGFSGFLLRSRLLIGWPGLEIKAYGPNGPLAVLRLDRLAPDVLFGLMDGPITKMAITQPPEGLHFEAPPAVQYPDRAPRVFKVADLNGAKEGSKDLAFEMITTSLTYTLTLGSP